MPFGQLTSIVWHRPSLPSVWNGGHFCGALAVDDDLAGVAVADPVAASVGAKLLARRAELRHAAPVDEDLAEAAWTEDRDAGPTRAPDEARRTLVGHASPSMVT